MKDKMKNFPLKRIYNHQDIAQNNQKQKQKIMMKEKSIEPL